MQGWQKIGGHFQGREFECKQQQHCHSGCEDHGWRHTLCECKGSLFLPQETNDAKLPQKQTKFLPTIPRWDEERSLKIVNKQKTDGYLKNYRS